MKIAGIDIGKKKTGISWGYMENTMVFPGLIVFHENEDIALAKILEVLNNERIKKAIVGIPFSDRSNIEDSFQHKIGEKLKEFIDTQYIDESFSTLEAREMLHTFGIKNNNEDIEASMVILKRYFDSF